jgi:Zinc-finger of C2H2 type
MVDKEKIKCDVCGQSFYSRKQLGQHAQDTHSTVNKKGMMKSVQKSFKISKKLIVIIGIIAIIGGIGIYSVMMAHASLQAVPAIPSIAGIQCNSMEQFAMHVHSHLDIIINGVYFLVPSQIGIPGNCFYWLHTHDESGIIHIEAPMQRDFTLGQFFDIWNKKLNNDQILNYVANANNPLTVYVNGTKVPNGTDFRDIKLNNGLNAHDEIAIVYGTPPSTIPRSYDFPEGT